MRQPSDRPPADEPSTIVLVPEDLVPAASAAGMRPRTNPPRPPRSSDQKLEGGALVVSSRLEFLSEKLEGRKAAPFWGPVRTGVGAYAEVYRVEESTHHAAELLGRSPLRRTLVAKLFRDGAPDDHVSVYTSELQTLRALGGHAHVVGLRGAADCVPPTFVCGHPECGRVFHVERCPQCDKPLHNADGRDPALVCPDRHRWLKYAADHVRKLTQARPCRHTDDVTIVNFLVRPCILLEELGLDLRALGEAIAATPGRPDSKSPTLAFEAKVGSDDRRREALLLRLDTLIGVAEGLAFLHAQGYLHAGVAPENAMVQLAAAPDGKGLVPSSVTTRLIDLGLAKRIKDSHTGAGAVGPMTFLAPEQMVASGSAGPTVSIRFRGGVPREGELCRIATTGGELAFERRDILRDADEGQYEVVSDAEVHHELRAQFGDKNATAAELARVRYARCLKVPRAARDLPQTSLRFSYALDVPADIFALGCLIAWSVTGGQEDLVHLLREQANLATRQRQVVAVGFAREFLRDDHRKLLAAIDLPPIDGDDMQSALVDIALRCLVRGEGAYCARRSAGFDRPALTIATDLRRVRNALFARMHAKDEPPGPPPEFGSAAPGDSERAQELSREVATLARALASANARAAEAERAAAEIEQAHGEAQEAIAEAERALAEAEQASDEVRNAKARAATDAGRIAALTRELEVLRAAAPDGDGVSADARRAANWRTVAFVACAITLIVGLIALQSSAMSGAGKPVASATTAPSTRPDPEAPPTEARTAPPDVKAPPVAEPAKAPPAGEPAKAPDPAPDKPASDDRRPRKPAMKSLTARGPEFIRSVCNFPADARGMVHVNFVIDSGTRRLIRIDLDDAQTVLDIPAGCISALTDRFRATRFDAADFRSPFHQIYTVLAQ